MNVLYMHTHDTGRFVSPYGFCAPTPAIMDFAKDSTLFSNSFTVSPTCSPSRASLLTGTYPHQNGMLGLAQRGFSLNDYGKHLNRFLQTKGFTCALCGIQHEAGWYLNVEDAEPLGYNEILTNSSTPYAKEDLFEWDLANAATAAEWIASARGKEPFMLSFGMHGTHRPFPVEVSPDLDERYVRPVASIASNPATKHDHAELMTSIGYVDECVSIVLRALKDAGLYDETIIVFTTDHGLAFPFNKCNLTDSGIGVMLMIRAPGSQTIGEVVETQVSQIDIYPTLCDLLGLEKPAFLEGESFAGLFEGREQEDRVVFGEINFHTSYEPCRSVRTKRYKYIRFFDDYDRLNISNIDNCATKTFLMENGLRAETKDLEALYDLFMDPNEKRNVAGEERYASVLAEMRELLHGFQVRTNDPLLEGPIPILPQYKVNKRACTEPSSRDPEDYEEEGRFY